jgi:hypothetical protein
MNPDLELSARLDALGRSLATSVPLDPPAEFMDGVRHQHKLTLVKRALWGSLAAALLLALVYFSARSTSHTTPTPRSPSYGDLRNVAPDDIDDAPLAPGEKPAPR